LIRSFFIFFLFAQKEIFARPAIQKMIFLRGTNLKKTTNPFSHRFYPSMFSWADFYGIIKLKASFGIRLTSLKRRIGRYAVFHFKL
jgi:hypothetical protein